MNTASRSVRQIASLFGSLNYADDDEERRGLNNFTFDNTNCIVITFQKFHLKFNGLLLDLLFWECVQIDFPRLE